MPFEFFPSGSSGRILFWEHIDQQISKKEPFKPIIYLLIQRIDIFARQFKNLVLGLKADNFLSTQE